MDGFNIVKELYSSNKSLNEQMYNLAGGLNKDINSLREQMSSINAKCDRILEQQGILYTMYLENQQSSKIPEKGNNAESTNKTRLLLANIKANLTPNKI